MPFTFLLRKTYSNVRESQTGLVPEIKMHFGLNFALKRTG